MAGVFDDRLYAVVEDPAFGPILTDWLQDHGYNDIADAIRSRSIYDLSIMEDIWYSFSWGDGCPDVEYGAGYIRCLEEGNPMSDNYGTLGDYLNWTAEQVAATIHDLEV